MKIDNNTIEEYNYDKIIDDLFECTGGKEYCLFQILPEHDYKKFVKKFIMEYGELIYKKIEELYTKNDMIFNKSSIIELEISSTIWNKYMMKLYYFDRSTHKLFEFNIKNNSACEISLYDSKIPSDSKACRLFGGHSYSSCFLTKTKNGSALWSEIEKEQNIRNKALDEAENERIYTEMIQTCKFLTQDEINNLQLIQTSLQYKDFYIRYICNGIFYYSRSTATKESPNKRIYFTFGTASDYIARHGYGHIFNKLFEDPNIDKHECE
ncbi:hypothetical protein BMW23_0412 [Bodo saltans virus]|uniref:Uncharacterized protein n=1 Tax=Bodo saltans virus TaxID=2024608 RepID=A0A2H4UUG5_9VIRU|nr:hypothetical protein QJ851_gp0402 [Bodo saltans virus]ATZ80465.1 hypothetical protein BMW23_0412 [Bodo saltans virus]